MSSLTPFGGVDGDLSYGESGAAKFDTLSYWDFGSLLSKFFKFLGSFIVCNRLGLLSSLKASLSGLIIFNCFIFVCTSGIRRN